MSARLWQIVERRLRQVLPPAYLASTIGDLAEDYERVRTCKGALRASLWLVRDAVSLIRAYRRARRSPQTTSKLMLADDFRLAWRRLVVHPSAPVQCVLLLAIGIGLSTTMFSVVDSLLLTPAPFRQGRHLVEQTFWQPEPAVMQAWRTSGMFEAVEAGRQARFQVGDTSETSAGAYVTPGVFGMLDARAVRGRLFSAQEAWTGANDVVLLSETVWRSSFGSDPALLGRRIRLSGTPVTVVGIMPETFRFPAPDTAWWRPFDPSAKTAGPATVFGRVRTGIPRIDLERRVEKMAREFGRIPANYRGTPALQPVAGGDLGAFTNRALWMLVGGVTLVFIVLCSNVSSLLLADLSSRRREFAVCAALGASRTRLLRQAAIEHVLIAAAGTVAGVCIARALVANVPEFFLGRSLNVIDVDHRALTAASVLGACSVLMAGLVPAWLGTRTEPSDAVLGSRYGTTDGRLNRTATQLLVVGQVALACALLVGSALLLRSFGNLAHADRGLNLDGVVHINLSGLDNAFPSPEAMGAGTNAIETQVASWPEVSSFALSREAPPSVRASRLEPQSTDGTARETGSGNLEADRYRVSPAFFGFYGIPIEQGRNFESGDSADLVIVGARLARLLWPGDDPIGKTFDSGDMGVNRVIGVAGEIHLPTLTRDLDRPEFYTPMGNRSRTVIVNMRCRSACPSAEVLRARLAAIHPAIGARIDPPSANEYLSHLRLPRALAKVGGLFAIVSILTAAGGLFSLMMQAVAGRRREFGIRLALGASPGQMRGLVLRDGLTMGACGATAGTIGGWTIGRALSGFQYGVTPADPATWAGVVGAIAIVALTATWCPARRAMRIDPVHLLREE